MQMVTRQHKTWIALLGLMVFLSLDFAASAKDGHDESETQTPSRFVGTELHDSSVSLLSLIDEREKQIRKGLETHQIEFNGDIFSCKPEATEEFVCGLGSINNRVELLGKAKELLNAINQLSNVREEDQEEFATIKEKLEKAVSEFIKVEEQKKQRATLDLKRLKEETEKELATINKQKLGNQNTTHLKDLLRQLKDIPDLSGEDAKERTALTDKLSERIKSLDKPQSQKSQDLAEIADEINSTLSSEGLNGLQNPIGLFSSSMFGAFRQNNGKTKNWSATLSKLGALRSRLESVGNLSEKELGLQKELSLKLSKQIELVEKFMKDSSSANSVISEKSDRNKPSTLPETQPPPKQEEIKDLERKLAETKKETQKIEGHLSSEKDLGINLELEYRLSLERLATYQNSLESQINEAKKASPTQLPPQLNRVDNYANIESPLIESPGTPSTEMNWPPAEASKNSTSAKPTSNDASSGSPPKSTTNSGNNSSAQNSNKQLSPSNNLAGNSVNGSEIPTNTDKPTSRISSLNDSSGTGHLDETESKFSTNNNGFSKDPFFSNRGNSTNPNSSNDSLSANDSKSKNRKIASIVNGSQSSDTGYDNGLKQNGNFISDPIRSNSMAQMGWGNNLKTANASSSSTSSKSLINDENTNKPNFNTDETIGDGRDSTGSEWGSTEGGYSLRRQPRRNLGSGYTKRRQNENGPQTNLASSSANSLTNAFAPEEKTLANKTTETAYIQNADGTFSKAPKKEDPISSGGRKPVFTDTQGIPSSVNSKSDDFDKISANIKLDMDSQLDLNTTEGNSAPSLLEMTGLQTTMDSIGTFLEQLYPDSRTQRKSEITKLLKKEKRGPAFVKLAAEIKTTASTETNQREITDNEMKPQASLVMKILAWLGFN